MEKVSHCLIKGIMAGIMIGIGGTIFLTLDNKIIGSFLFGIGLFMIVTRTLNLYTGKVGYIVENPPKYLLQVGVTLIGNFIGTFVVGYILKYTRIYDIIQTKVTNLCNIKLSDDLISVFILSLLCGLLMFLAVDGYKQGKDELAKYLSVFLSVMVFILCGFEHSIANMFYFSLASMLNGKVAIYLLVMILGNGVGGILFPICKKLMKE